MKLCVLGHFGRGKTLLNGQTIKTKNLAAGLEAHAQVVQVDTHGWNRRPLGLFKELTAACKACDGIIMLPAHNGVRVFAPLLAFLKKIYGIRIYYDVIGGWLPELVEQKPGLKKPLSAFDGIWVETATMEKKLHAMGFSNVRIIPNFKDFQPLMPQALPRTYEEPYRLCTFSRVMPPKGIGTAVEAVKAANAQLGRTAFVLDIYGPVEAGAEDWFEELKSSFPDFVSYGGSVASQESVRVLQDYFALLFPTLFYTEGIPGTILDAYAAGVPVVASRWESFGDIVRENITGLGYPFGDTGALTGSLVKIAKDPALILQKKTACLEYAQRFARERVVGQILRALEENP